MSQPLRHATLRTAELRQLEQLTDQFVSSWRACGPRDKAASLAAYLPQPGDPLRVPALEMLIPIDLEHRWARHERVLLEDYLKAYPELGSVDTLAVEIILTEHHIRSTHGDTPSIETYRERFPGQFTKLQSMLDQPPRARGTLYSRHDSTVIPATKSTPSSTPTLAPNPAPNLAGSSRRIVPIGDGYQLLESIGRGAYGEVWRATAPGGVEVAIKLIKWTSSNSLTQVELRALELMKRLRHAFLSQVQAYWLADDYLYIVMDLADGSLEQRFDECRRQGLTGIPAEELIGYMREAAEGLDYLHANQVLHRDVKPANILLSSGHARLADFGLARLFRDENAQLGATVIGTPLYMGPEVWEQKVGPSSDQYSLASSYVELRLGRALFEATTQIEVMKKHLSMRPDLQPLPPKEQRVLHRALAKKGTERYSTCAEFVADLHTAVTGYAQPKIPGLTRRRMLAIGVLTCFAGGATVAGLSWSGFQFKLVAPTPTVLPPNCEPAAGATEVFVAAEGVNYWNRIVRKLPNNAVLPSGMPCVFVLVPYHTEQRLPSFYIFENKVWNELFAEFNNQHLRANPELADLEKWPVDWAERGADKDHGEDMPAASYPRHPVMRVGYQQAGEFAKWLGGSLPSPQQWDVAAGLYSAAAKKDGVVGPFRGDWSSNSRPRIAVGTDGKGTKPVGDSEDDISPFSCRDMAGNGAEWTSEATAGGYSTVTLRGRDYHKDRPLFYSDLLAANSTEIEKEDPYYTSDHIGFRVVIDPSQRATPASDNDQKGGPKAS